jgi:hypothetical protein
MIVLVNAIGIYAVGLLSLGMVLERISASPFGRAACFGRAIGFHGWVAFACLPGVAVLGACCPPLPVWAVGVLVTAVLAGADAWYAFGERGLYQQERSEAE